MAIPTGQLTRASIVNRACRRAGNTQLAQGPDYEAQIWLNQILYDLYTQFDWPFTRVTTTLTLGNTVALPSDFLRPTSDTALILSTVDGVAQGGTILEIDRRRYDMLLARTPGVTANMPDVYTVVYETNSLSFYPTFTSAITAQYTYNALPAEIAIDTSGDSVVPTFPWHDYLIQALFVAVLQYENDGRVPGETQNREAMLQRCRNIAWPSRAADPTIPLDPSVFSRPFDSSDDFTGWGWPR